MAEKSSSAIETWDPFRELNLLRGWPAMRSRAGLHAGGLPTPARWTPSLDLTENETHYVVSVELAGAKKDDVRVEIDDGVLTIRGEKRNEREEKTEERRYSERSFGMFSRSFTLPSNANDDEVAASFKDGVLKVEIAKRQEAKPKAIEVH